jgi:hypothetical protein
VIETRRAHRTFGDGLIAEEVKDLREDWIPIRCWPRIERCKIFNCAAGFFGESMPTLQETT